MRLVSYRVDGGIRLAMRQGGRLVDAGGAPLNDVLAGSAALRPGGELDEAGLRLAPAVPSPGKIICIGQNYRRHAEESGAPIPTIPILFSKFSNALAAGGDEVPLPKVAVQYDYEAELAVVIGARARNVSEAQAPDHVWGYCCANDISARDLQLQTSQWLIGKSLDRFLPLGPELVSADEVGDPAALGIRCFLNGEKRQDSTVGDMIFSVPELVGFISRHIALDPGDVICTGTPEGVILGMAEKRWMVPGDEVVVEIDRLGRLSNRMVADPDD